VLNLQAKYAPAKITVAIGFIPHTHETHSLVLIHPARPDVHRRQLPRKSQEFDFDQKAKLESPAGQLRGCDDLVIF
jgi:hypothetical protein